MIGRLLFRLFGLEERPDYESVKKLSSPRKIPVPRTSDAEKLLDYLRRKHMVDGISIFTEEGTLIATTYAEEDALHEYSLFEQVSFELENLSHVYLKGDEWIITFKRGSYVYIIHVPSYMNMVELSAVARDAEKLLFGLGW